MSKRGRRKKRGRQRRMKEIAKYTRKKKKEEGK